MSDLLLFLADCAFKSSIILGLACIAAFILRRRSASLRHLIWSAALLAVVVLPALLKWLPEMRSHPSLSTITRFSPPLKRIDASSGALDETASQDPSSVPSDPSRQFAVESVWFLGSMLIGILLMREAGKLARIA